MHIKVNETLYPATITGRVADRDWDSRASKLITLDMTYAEALALLPDNTPWSIVEKSEVPTYAEDGSYAYDEDGNQIMEEKTTEWDNSEYSMSGDITDHRDGTVTIKMGKPTDLETAYEQMIGG
nr:MAG TPA: hypothetical protein [Caudoviricetes sp.]